MDIKTRVLLIVALLRNMFWGTDIRPAQIMLGLSSLLWALMLVHPGDTFQRQTYAVMAAIGSEHAWAAAFVLVGVSQLYNSFISVLPEIPAWFSKFDSFLCFVVWATAVCSILVAQRPPPAAIAGEIVMAFAAFWVFVRQDLPVLKARRSSDV